MQSNRKFTKCLRAKNDSDQLLRALNNLIKIRLGGDYKSVVALTKLYFYST